jgi:hypothetical protein
MDLIAPGIEISYSKTKITLFLLIFMGMLGYLYYFFFVQKLVFESYNHMLFSYMSLAVAVGISFIYMIKFLFLLFDPGPALMINTIGVFYRPSTFISLEIPWNYIYELRTKRVKSAKYPMLMIEYDPELYSQISFTNKLVFYPKLLFRPKSISINTSIMMISYKKLFDILTTELEKNRQLTTNN